MAKRVSMTDEIVSKLREDLINWKYEENNIITETEIANAYNVSKTPAREALTTLCMEGFLEKLPNKGYLVKGISVLELQSLFEFRAILETAAAELAIKYASEKDMKILEKLAKQNENNSEYASYSEVNYNFHIHIAYMSRNSYLLSALKNVMIQLRRVLIADWKDASNMDDEYMLDMHQEICRAIREKNVEDAKKYIIEEINNTNHRIYFREAGDRMPRY